MSNTKRSRSKGKCLMYLLCAAIVFRTKWLEGHTSWTKGFSDVVPDKSATDIKVSSTSNDVREPQKV